MTFDGLKAQMRSIFLRFHPAGKKFSSNDPLMVLIRSMVVTTPSLVHEIAANLADDRQLVKELSRRRIWSLEFSYSEGGKRVESSEYKV